LLRVSIKCLFPCLTMRNFLLMGAPGSGKGTYGKLLASVFDIPHLSSGGQFLCSPSFPQTSSVPPPQLADTIILHTDLIRKEIASKSIIGQSIQKCSESGGLVPDEVITMMTTLSLKRLKEERAGKPPGFLLDGFPRTIIQAKALQDAYPINLCINIILPEDAIIAKLLGRLGCPSKKRLST
jgi:adenylate kinase